jgi:methylenetetrahydrofolate reductase (NADPH)
MHGAVFEPGSLAFGAGRKVAGAVERAPRPIGRLAHGVEHATKAVLFSCRDCGDCSLPETGFLCPESQCVKNQRNGPCGGTRQGLCEIGEKECIWVRAYERLKAYGEEETMLDGPAVIKNAALEGTSAWGNTYLGRDHHAAQHQAAAPTDETKEREA